MPCCSRLAWFIVVLALCGALVAPAHAQQLSPEEVQLLEQLDSETLRRALELAAQFPGWRQRIADLRRQREQDRDQVEQQIERWREQYAKVPQEGAERAAQLRTLQQQLSEILAGDVSLASLRQFIEQLDAERRQWPESAQSWFSGLDEIKRLLDDAEQRWRSAQRDAEQYAGFSDSAYRRLVQRRVYAEVLAQFEATADEQLFRKLEMVRNPAMYARSFLDGKFREWTEKPLPLDDAGEFVARILPPPQGVSLFSPQANLGVEIEYIEDSLSVKATGLYFEYEPGGLPRPNISQLRLDPAENLKGKVFSELKQLGTEITEDLDLPIKVTITDPPDFTALAGGLRGGIGFSIEAGLMTEGLVKAKAENLRLYPGNKVDWNDGKLKISYPLQPPVPVGTTPLGFWTLEGDYQPSMRKMGFETKISTLATPPETVALEVRVETEFPIERIGVSGALVLLGSSSLQFARVDGSIDFSKGVVAGKFTPASGAVGGMLGMGEGTFELRTERLLMQGSMKLLDRQLAQAQAVIDFQKASAAVAAESGLNLFGADFASNLLVEVRPRFESVRFEAVASVLVPGVQPFGDIWAVVTVKGDSAVSDEVAVHVDTFVEGLQIDTTVPNLAACTPEKLHQWLQDKAVEQYHRLLKDIAAAEKDGRKWAAQLDEKTRRYVSDRLGGAWKTGNPELDAFGSELSREWKNVGGSLSDAGQAIGGGLTDAREGLQQGASDVTGALGLPW